MNASASALTREDEVQSKVRKVRTFGRVARTLCAALFGMSLVGSVGMLLVVLFGPLPGAHTYIDFVGYGRVSAAQLTTPLFKLWAILVMGIGTGVALAGLYQLYRLFGNLAAGAIYTPENVRRVRYVGFLWLLLSVLGVVIPVATAALGYFDTLTIQHGLPVSQVISSFFAAGLILLVSWIMDVGLYAKDHADELQRDADLVI